MSSGSGSSGIQSMFATSSDQAGIRRGDVIVRYNGEPVGPGNSMSQLRQRIARTEPAYYSAMFEAGIPLDTNPELRDAGDRAFAVLRTATERLVGTMPANNRPPVLMMALHIWAMSHGIAALFGRGDAGRRSLPMSAEDLLEAAVLVYLRGLGITNPSGDATPL